MIDQRVSHPYAEQIPACKKPLYEEQCFKKRGGRVGSLSLWLLCQELQKQSYSCSSRNNSFTVQ